MILQVALCYWRLAPAFFPLTTLTSSPFNLFFVKQFSPQRWKDLQMVTIHISNFGQNQNSHVFLSSWHPGYAYPVSRRNVFRVEKHLETKGVWPEVPPTRTVRLGLTRNLFVMDWREILESLGRFLLNLPSDKVLEIIGFFFSTPFGRLFVFCDGSNGWVRLSAA